MMADIIPVFFSNSDNMLHLINIYMVSFQKQLLSIEQTFSTFSQKYITSLKNLKTCMKVPVSEMFLLIGCIIKLVK